jgi:hypothetical protein
VQDEGSTLNSLDTFSDEEQMLRESGIFLSSSLLAQLIESQTVQRFATDIVGPKVREMDENEQMDPSIVKSLFEQGVRSHTTLNLCPHANLTLAYGY